MHVDRPRDPQTNAVRRPFMARLTSTRRASLMARAGPAALSTAAVVRSVHEFCCFSAGLDGGVEFRSDGGRLDGGGEPLGQTGARPKCTRAVNCPRP